MGSMSLGVSRGWEVSNVKEVLAVVPPGSNEFAAISKVSLVTVLK
jgi:hypothetical protein